MNMFHFSGDYLNAARIFHTLLEIKFEVVLEYTISRNHRHDTGEFTPTCRLFSIDLTQKLTYDVRERAGDKVLPNDSAHSRRKTKRSF